jgi:hypothetical protein
MNTMIILNVSGARQQSLRMWRFGKRRKTR